MHQLTTAAQTGAEQHSPDQHPQPIYKVHLHPAVLLPSDAAAELHAKFEQVIKVLTAVHDGSSVVLQNCHTHKEVEVLMVGISPESLPETQHLQQHTQASC